MKNNLIQIAIAIAIAVLVHTLFTTRYSDFTVTDSLGTRTIGLPFQKDSSSKANRRFSVEGYISPATFSARTFQIIPDDQVIAIYVNQQNISLKHIPEKQLSDWSKGFAIDLSQYLTEGKNHIKVEVLNKGGRYGLLISNSLTATSQIFYWLALALCLLIGSFSVLRLFNFRTEICAVISAGFLLRWFYVLITGFNTRGHDTWEHIEYVMHFTESWILPDVASAKGGAYFHPPFYYWLSSIIFDASQWFHPDNNEVGYKWLQYASTLYSFIFIVFAAKLIELFFQELNTTNPSFRSKNQPQAFFKLTSPRPYIFAATASLCVWPGAILHSSRIGNDPLLYCLFIVSAYYIFRFYLTPKPHLFVIGAIVTAFAVITKANAAVLGLAGAGVVIYHWQKIGFGLPAKAIVKGIVPCLLLVGAAGVTFYPGIALKLKGDRTHLYVDNLDNISSALQVGNDAKNFLWFDVKTFINEPYTSPWDDKLGRQYFANYLVPIHK